MNFRRRFIAGLIALPLVDAAKPRNRRHSGFIRATDGVRIHYVDYGRGSTIVLLHGGTGSAASNFEQTGIATGLARSHRVIAIDFRGHGESDQPLSAGAYRPDRLVEDVLAVLDARKVGRVHLVGYSIGGAIARRLVSAAPERVLSVTLGGDGGWRVLGTEDPVGVDVSPPPATGLMWGDPSGAVYRAFNGGVSKPAVHSDRPSFGALRLPVLQILGQFDYPNTMSKPLRQSTSNYRLAVLPGRTHLTALADPQFLTEVSEFVERLEKK